MVGFLSLYSYAIWETWTAGSLPKFKESYIYVATSLAGLIGGVFATVFNQNLPPQPGLSPSLGSAERRPKFGISGFQIALKRSLTLQFGDVLSWATFAYVVSYLLIGIASIVTWVGADQTPDLIKNLALISIGVFLAVARFFFDIPDPESKPQSGAKEDNISLRAFSACTQEQPLQTLGRHAGTFAFGCGTITALRECNLKN